MTKPLSDELVELFDMKKARMREEKELNQAATDAQKDIRLLTLMFRDGIPDIEVPLGDEEFLKWDSQSQKLLYQKGNYVQVVEGTSREIRIMIRPFLTALVKKAKAFYSNEGKLNA